MPADAKRYSVFSHDGWGSTTVGGFSTIEEARQLFETLRTDPWFCGDGAVRSIALVDTLSQRTLELFRFPGAPEGF